MLNIAIGVRKQTVMGLKTLSFIAIFALSTPFVLSGCNSPQATPPASKQGKLALVANGEDFVRKGFVSKDGWRIDFDHVYVTLAEAIAYQTEPAFNPDTDHQIKAKQTIILLEKATTIDLAAGEEDAKAIAVTEVDAPEGNYNALSWKVVPAEDDTIGSQTIVLDGIASKGEQQIKFLLGFNQPLDYTCGEFVGEERKGIVQNGVNAEVETTFHFDHIFGDADTPADDPLNKDALGFEAIATLAQDNIVEADLPTLQQNLSPEAYQKLTQAIASLGHVGEGHCTLKK